MPQHNNTLSSISLSRSGKQKRIEIAPTTAVGLSKKIVEWKLPSVVDGSGTVGIRGGRSNVSAREVDPLDGVVR